VEAIELEGVLVVAGCHVVVGVVVGGTQVVVGAGSQVVVGVGVGAGASPAQFQVIWNTPTDRAAKCSKRS